MAGGSGPLVDSIVERTVAAGQTVATSVNNDPIAPGESIELLAVPVMAEGQVVAVLALWRQAGVPFTDTDRTELASFAPNVGAALTKTSTLSTLSTPVAPLRSR